LCAFSFIKQPVLLASDEPNIQPPLGAQDLFSGQRPAELPPQVVWAPFVNTECAANAQAAIITTTNIAVFKLFKLPEPDEQHSPPEPDDSLLFSFPCVISSFVSISFPQK